LLSRVAIDEYGRYLPETVRFPSAKEGNGFKALADDMNSDDRFFAIFNTSDTEKEITFDFEQAHLRDKYKIRDLWNHDDLGEFQGSFSATLPSHGAGLYRMINASD